MNIPEVAPPRRISAKAIAGTLVVAAAVLVLVAVVLRTAYGIDPLGLARFGPKEPGPLTSHAATYKIDSIELFLIPTQRVEYKYRLDKGATMVYTWKADHRVYFDLHTVPDGKPPEASESMASGETDQSHGSYTSPYAGLHGWFWENRGDTPVTITLLTAGFYTGATMFSDGEQTPMEVKDPEPPPEQ